MLAEANGAINVEKALIVQISGTTHAQAQASRGVSTHLEQIAEQAHAHGQGLHAALALVAELRAAAAHTRN
jgi:hypothetical protein